MKIIQLFLCFSFLLLPVIIFGQANSLEVGICGGSGMRILTGNSIDKNHSEPAVGYHIGGTIQYHFTENFSLRTDPGFEQKGITDYIVFTDNVGNEIGHLKSQNNLNYIVLPVMGQLCFGNRIAFTLHAGAFAGYLIRNNLKMPAIETNPEQKFDITGSDKRFDMGLAGGFGCQFPVKDNFSIFLDARINAGIFNIASSSSLFEPIHTNSLNLTMGIKYRFARE